MTVPGAGLRRLAGGLLLLLACWAGAVDAAGSARRVALVIGNAAYADAPLANPVNDARGIGERLRALGFEVSVLTDADRRAMERATLEFSARLDAETTALFYYAGHGVQSRGRNYLLPIGARVDSEAALRFEALDVGVLLDEIGQANSRVNFVILDACRNNPFERKVRGGGQGLVAIDAARGTLIAYATSPGSVAVDGEGSHGLYTAELLKALEAPGLKAEDVFKRVRIAVSDRSGGLQVPWESSSLTGDFVFNPAGAEPVAAQPPPAAAGGATLEQSLWDSARSLDSPAAYQAYLDQFPQGVFAAMARLHLGQGGGAAARAVGGRCELEGAWHQTVPSLGCESTLHFARRDDGSFALREEGCGNVTGQARFVGEALVVDWSVAWGLCQGRTELQFEPGCARATGEVVMPGGLLGCSGRHPSELTRATAAP